MPLQVSVSRKAILRVLALAVFLVMAANLFHQLSWFLFEQDYKGFGWKFDVSDDRNVPTWYASASLFFCAVLIWLTALVEEREKSRYVWHWRGLCAIFLLLSLDETASLHEWAGDHVPDAGVHRVTSLLSDRGLDVSNLLYYQWVVWGALFVAVVGLVYVRFLLALPRDTRWLFLAAAGIFIGGALAMEMLNARTEVLYGADTVIYSVMTAFEEFCEMVGVLVFAYALLRHLGGKVKAIHLQLNP